MKLIDFFSRAKRRGTYSEEIDPQARLANDRTDRSSMADLVRLLQKHDRSRQESDDRAIL